MSFRALFGVSLGGGALGGWLLLWNTPSTFFARLAPWLVLFATALFAWGSFLRRRPSREKRSLPPWAQAPAQFGIAIYGGYFGGGIGLLMMAALTIAGMATRPAGATKNALAGVMNASAVGLFLFLPKSTGAGRRHHAGARRRLARRAAAAEGQRKGPAGRRGGDRRRADDRAVHQGAVESG